MSSDKKRNSSQTETEPNTKKKSMKQALLRPLLSKSGVVKVARYFPGKPAPVTPGFRNIVIHTSGANLGGDLSPYVLRNEKGQLLENIWQFAKIYRTVAAQRTKLSRFHPDKIIWTHPSEIHIVDEDTVTREYWSWRRKGMDNEWAVRYPNGFEARRNAVASLWIVDGQLRWLDYIAARKHIYCGEYARLAPQTVHFRQLLGLLVEGENLQIVEVDGPDPSLTYGPYASISPESPGMLMDEAKCKFLLNDPQKSFGHGFVIASLLIGGASWMLPDD